MFMAISLGWSVAAVAEGTVVFDGNKFTAKITNNCPEGDVTCDDVTFDSKSKKTGSGIVLKGKTVNVNCPATCDFRGYEFKNGVYTYSIFSNDSDRWILNVFKGKELVSSDVGTLN